jgi:phage terminase large subunit-like protein
MRTAQQDIEMKALLELEAQMDKAIKDASHNKLRDYVPYLKQEEFHALGLTKRERLLMAGNQLGKTYSGAMETACHLTGQYPKDWSGRKWDRPVKGWAGGVSSQVCRDVLQALLVGEPWPLGKGTGALPLDTIVDVSMARGIQDAIDTIYVRHVTGGLSTLSFKSYEQGRSKWQGSTLDFVWFDEEPPYEIYSEGMTRTNATKGFVFMTFTPLMGMSDVVLRFTEEDNASRGMVQMTINDAGHISEAEREIIIASYEPWEREARLNGVPMLGSGRIFPLPEEYITCEPFEIPDYWGLLVGLDIGIDHPTAAVKLAFDPDTDTIYVCGEHRARGEAIPVHAAAIRAWNPNIPVAWPHDGHSRDKGSGLNISRQYAAAGCTMMATHAQFSKSEGGGNSVEAGVSDMLERMRTGRLKVFRTCPDWFGEFRMYHRADGLIVKERDDLLSATRYGIMMRRFGKPLRDLRGNRGRKSGKARIAKGADFDVFRT